MTDKKLLDALRNLKGRRIYQFYLDEKTGEITDITYSMEYVKPIRCKDCKWFEHDLDDFGDCTLDGGYQYTVYTNDYCSHAERKEE